MAHVCVVIELGMPANFTRKCQKKECGDINIFN
jgi:hypothetical protein